MITLENENLLITAKQEGAELTRIYDKKHRRECLWTADPAFWNRHAPVLFPVVGRCKNCEYRYKGKTYPLGQHGFCRDAVFEIESQSESQVTFVLRASEETKAVYPFDFVLKLTYTLEADQVITTYRVENASETEDLYFSIGGHPGFLYDGSIDEQVFAFDEKENLDRLLLTPQGQFSRAVQKDFVKNGEDIHLYEGIFKDDALVFHDFKFNKITLKNEKTGRGVEMDLTGFPYVGLWSANKAGAPYACIEPWYGLADYEDFNGELPQKDGIQKLAAKEAFECHYTVKPI